MSKIELKPCPFCGSDDVICDMFEDVYFVECWNCCAKVESYNGPEDAVAGWNARVINRDELWDVVESLEKPWPVGKGKHDTIQREDVQLFEREMAARIRKAVGE